MNLGDAMMVSLLGTVQPSGLHRVRWTRSRGLPTAPDDTSHGSGSGPPRDGLAPPERTPPRRVMRHRCEPVRDGLARRTFRGGAGGVCVLAGPANGAGVEEDAMVRGGARRRPRLTTPMIRESGALRPATWDEALELAAEGMEQVRDTHGPGALGLFSCSKATNETNYIAQKFARAVLGTNNIDSCNRT
jgi:formate dehydrogenase (hydrogenase)